MNTYCATWLAGYRAALRRWERSLDHEPSIAERRVATRSGVEYKRRVLGAVLRFRCKECGTVTRQTGLVARCGACKSGRVEVVG